MHIITIGLISNEICVSPQRNPNLLSWHGNRLGLLLLHLLLLHFHRLDCFAQILGHAHETRFEVAQLYFLYF